MTNVSVSIPPKWLEKIDKKRGDIPRSKFIFRLLEAVMKTEEKIALEKKTMTADNSFTSRDQQPSIVGV